MRWRSAACCCSAGSCRTCSAATAPSWPAWPGSPPRRRWPGRRRTSRSWPPGGPPRARSGRCSPRPRWRPSPRRSPAPPPAAPRSPAPARLLPLRVRADRDRAASLIALTLASAGIYSVFLFLTYYLQTVQAYTPVRTGLAFLPMIATTITGSVLGANVLLTRIGPRPTLPLGMLASAAGMAWLTRLTVTSSYPAAVLGPLLILGLGLGLIFAPAITLGTPPLRGHSAAAASARRTT